MNAGGDIFSGALQGALTGASVGGPWGAAAGLVLGGASGFINNKNAEQQTANMLSQIPANYNSSPFGVVTMADGGVAINNPLVNIEEGELMVDPQTGDILEEFSSRRGFKKHSKTNEPSNNFVPLPEGAFIIPKKHAEEYKNNQNLRQGLIRQLRMKQVDREQYGVDADGNKVEYAAIQKDFQKMKKGGFIKKYFPGGGEESDIITGLKGKPYPLQYVSNPATPIPSVLPFASDLPFAKDVNPNPVSLPLSNPITSIGYEMTGLPKVEPSLKRLQDASFENMGDSGLSRLYPKPENHFNTLGNKVGAAGTVLGALGPMAVTLLNGIDRDENNYYSGVATQAQGLAKDSFRGVTERATRDMRLNANIASNMNRNRKTNYAGMLAAAQENNRQTTTGLSNFLNQQSELQAKLMSGLSLQGAMTNAQGLTQRDMALDQNRDAYFTNLNKDLTNAAMNTQAFGKNLNVNDVNNIAFNSLNHMSSFYTINPDGTIKFR